MQAEINSPARPPVPVIPGVETGTEYSMRWLEARRERLWGRECRLWARIEEARDAGRDTRALEERWARVQRASVATQRAIVRAILGAE